MADSRGCNSRNIDILRNIKIYRIMEVENEINWYKKYS